MIETKYLTKSKLMKNRWKLVHGLRKPWVRRKDVKSGLNHVNGRVCIYGPMKKQKGILGAGSHASSSRTWCPPH